MPVFKTHKIPVSTLRGSTGLRPGQRRRRGFTAGSTGWISAQRASSNNGLAMCLPPKLR
jgi:hypothetical protein